MALVCHTQLYYDLVVSGKSPWPGGLLFPSAGHERLGLSQACLFGVARELGLDKCQVVVVLGGPAFEAPSEVW